MSCNLPQPSIKNTVIIITNIVTDNSGLPTAQMKLTPA